ncbi:cytochrome b6-f complex iron-sulfur subunit [Fistulifera solaris]|jgi:cytochrome b6-f complex iron-sulfur subunit|uniref:plastoquinol--plastocyanin reductase n=1 Tax=Fistulifera solaris TaxID=1519565 RepID=A0A1Z5K7W8_FISSO|nr:cytochrome b6-f complex iron-sulfur subunit [Fistulifera solaris]|eukprot:GAX22353.1 cytochrome b6-f complex iron-sulfur subunit [Fistulifera solaris]
MMILSTILSLATLSLATAFVPTTSVTPSQLAVSSTAVPEEFYINEERRLLMNMLMVGAGGLTVLGLGVPYIAFFVPPGSVGETGGVAAKDALGKDILFTEYVATKPTGDRSLVQGLKGDATYLIVNDDKTLESYGLNAVCTHLGCVVPWSAANNKFICPCHASQYAPDGTVLRGPAPLPLALAHCDVDEASDKILFSPWTETDFRTGEKGWWN